MNQSNILETIRMLDQEKLDIRTVTMGISLLDCIDGDAKISQGKIYDKMMGYCANLVDHAEKVSRKYGISIINKRLSVTPMSLVVAQSNQDQCVDFAKTLDRVAQESGIDFVGGYSALVQSAMTQTDRTFIDSIPQALAETNKVCSSVNLASSKTGINMDAVKKMGEVIKEAAEKTKDQDSIACAKLVVFCNGVEDNPFMAGAYHGPGLGDACIHVGVSGPGVVKSALEKVQGESFEEVSECIKKTAFKMTRIGQLIGMEVAKSLEIAFGSIDLSLAPTPAIGDSVARILEEIGLTSVGFHGTTAALAMLNDAVKKGGIMASSHVGGLSGAFIPVSEDEGMIAAAKAGTLTFDKLEAMTSVCSVGLDMIALPGDTTAATLSGIIADEAAIGMINHKTTAVRLIPVVGKGLGDVANFGGLLGYAPILPVHQGSCEKMINRGGFIPSPITAFKN